MDTELEQVEAVLDGKKVLVRYAVVGIIVKVLVEEKEAGENDWYEADDLTDSSTKEISTLNGEILLICEDEEDANKHRHSLVNVV